MARDGGIRRGSALRTAATALLAAWDAADGEALVTAVAALRAAAAPARAAGPSRDPAAPRAPRPGTMQAAVLALLRRDQGATIVQVMDPTGWQKHRVRGFLAGLTRKGMRVSVLARVRQVGPGQLGAKGSYSVYRLVGAG